MGLLDEIKQRSKYESGANCGPFDCYTVHRKDYEAMMSLARLAERVERWSPSSVMGELDVYTLDGLIEEIRGAIATLEDPGDGIGTPAAFGFDAEDRVLAPDEIMERAEEEEAREREEG